MEKEKRTQEVRVLMEPSLHQKLQERSHEEYKTVSEVVRELIVQYLKGGK